MSRRGALTILLTGATGQVGYELERSLQGLGRVVAPRGRLVVNAVTIETQAELTRRFTALGGELLSFNFARADRIGGFHGWRAAMPVVQWSVIKP